MTKRFHPLTDWKCEQITAETDGIGQGISHESMRAVYDYAVTVCSNWIHSRFDHSILCSKELALQMEEEVLAEPKGLKARMLYAFENDEDHDRLLELIHSMKEDS